MSNTSDSPTAAACFGAPSTLDHDDQPDLPFASPLPRAERPFLEEDENPFAFDHVALRFRHDGWTPERQERFIEALAATGCVEQAARAVGKSVSSAYALKTRAEARPFRLAWEAALEVGIKRLSEAALSRAIHGVAQPIFYKGEQVGERRHYDERLTMFLLRYRDPARFGPWIDRVDSVEEKFDGAPMLLRQLLNRMVDKLFGEAGEDAFDRAVARGELPEDAPEPEDDEDEDWDEECEDEVEDEETPCSGPDPEPMAGAVTPGEDVLRVAPGAQGNAHRDDRRPGAGLGHFEEMAPDSPSGPGLRRGDGAGADPDRRWRAPEPRVRLL